MHWLKYIPAGLLLAIAVFFLLASMAGDNSDARALAGVMLIPAIAFAALSAAAAVLAYLL